MAKFGACLILPTGKMEIHIRFTYQGMGMYGMKSSMGFPREDPDDRQKGKNAGCNHAAGAQPYKAQQHLSKKHQFPTPFFRGSESAPY